MIAMGSPRGPTRRRLTALLLAALAAALVVAAPASTQGRYTDKAGDAGAAPDIVGVTVSGDRNGGNLVFRITDASLNNQADVLTWLYLDTDLNPATGSPADNGADYVFVVGEKESSYGFGRWSGSRWDETPYTTVAVYSDPHGVTISVNRSELGNTGEFDFWVQTVDMATLQTDEAPDGGGSWNYQLAADGPNIKGVLLKTKPVGGPRAGKVFAVTPVGVQMPTSGPAAAAPAPEAYSCTARLGGTRLAGSGRGGCAWKLGKKARGKRLVVVVKASFGGATKSFQFPYRVR